MAWNEEELKAMDTLEVGYAAEIALADVQSCDNCIVAFDPTGGLRTVLLGQSGKVQVKDLIEIQLKGSTTG